MARQRTNSGLAAAVDGFFDGYQTVKGIQRQEQLNAQQDAKFKAWQDQQEYDTETRRQQAGLADQMQNGAVDSDKTAAGLNAYAQPGDEAPSQWTSDQVRGLRTGPGSAFDAAAGPAIPAVRAPLKQSDFYRKTAGLAMRKGDSSGSAQAMAMSKASGTDEAVQEAMEIRAKNPDLYDDHLMATGNLAGNMPATFKPTKGKNGYITMDVVGGDGKVLTKDLSPAQRTQLALGHAYMAAGAYDKGVAHLEQVDKDLADAIVRKNTNLFQGAQSNNQATHFAATDAYHQQQLGIQREHLSLSQQQARKGEAVQLVDKDGNAHIFYLRPDTQSGEVVLPDGMKFPRQRPQIDEAAVAKYVASMEGQPVTTPDGRQVTGPDGKAIKYNAMTAREAVVRQLYGSAQDSSGLAVPAAASREKAAAILSGAQPQSQQSAPAAPRGLEPPMTLRQAQAAANAAGQQQRVNSSLVQGVRLGSGLTPEDLQNLQYLQGQ